MRRTTLTRILVLFLTACTSAIAEGDGAFSFADNRLTITTSMLQLGFDAGAIVYLKDRDSGEVLVDADPFDYRPIHYPRIDDAGTYPIYDQVYTEISPTHVTVQYTLKYHSALYDFTVDSQTGEVIIQVTGTFNSKPSVLGIGIIDFQGEAVHLGGGSSFYRADSNETDNGYNPYGGPNMGILEGTNAVVAAWPEETNYCKTYVQAQHTQARDALLLLTCQDRKETDANRMIGVPFRIGTYSTWLAAAKRWRVRFEARTGAKPLWQNRCTWLRNIHAMYSAGYSTTAEEYETLGALVDPNTLLMMNATAEEMVLFGDMTRIASNVWPDTDDLEKINKFGWHCGVYYWWNLIQSPFAIGVDAQLSELAAAGKLPDGYDANSFHPYITDSAYVGDVNDAYGYWVNYWADAIADLNDPGEWFVIHPGSSKFQNYIVENYKRWADLYGYQACYFDILGSDHSRDWTAVGKSPLVDGNDYIEGEVQCLQRIYERDPNLIVHTEYPQWWLLPYIFYSWQGVKSFYSTPVEHPLRGALMASYCWSRDYNMNDGGGKYINDRLGALLGALPIVSLPGDWRVDADRAAVSMARAKLFCDEELFNDLPDEWEDGILAYYRSQRTGNWFKLVDNGSNLQYVETLPDGSQTVRLTVAVTSNAHALTLDASNGTVSKSPDKDSYSDGEVVTLQATPSAGHTFTGWSGNLAGSENPATITMDGDKSVTANFAANVYALTTTATGGSVSRSPDQASYEYGTEVTLVATANAGYTFTGWSGALSGTTNPADVVIDGDKSVTANFAASTYTLSVSATNGSVTKSPDQATYTHGQTVTLTAVAATGYSFGSWSGDASGTTATTTVTMDATKSVTAGFTANAYTLDVSAANGSVTKSPDQATYTHGQTVTLTAVAATGYSFGSWSGDASGTTATTTVTMNADRSVTAGFTINTYTLTVAATDGTIARNPDKSSYTYGETVTLQATPATGYNFVSWSDDLSGSTNPATLVMDEDKSVTAAFAANTYTLTTTAANGSVTRSPDQASYAHGEVVTLTAAADTGYSFSAWSGDASGTAATTTVMMNDDRSVTANFTANTYTLSVASENGSVALSPDQASYTYGEVVTLTAVADAGYRFSAWSGDASGTAASTTVTMNADKSVAATFERESDDQDPPVLLSSSPAANAIQAPRNSIVLLHIADAGDGVDANTVSILVNGQSVYTGNVASHTSSSGVCRRVGTAADYTYAYQANADFDYDATITVTVNAADLAGNAMAQKSYGFKTEMRSFGVNRCASWGPQGADRGAPATVCDADGSIWVVYHAGDVGSRDIYVSKRAAGSDEFADPVQVTTNVLDQCNADIAVGTNGVLYVVWQDNRRGNWDLYASTSADGVTWSAAVRVADSDNDEINPAIAVDSQSPNRVYVAWEDNRAGNRDIYVSRSIAGFASATVQAVTSNVQDQTDPRIAVDGSNTVYVVWTDARNQSKDIYGAASNSGPWTNVPIVTGTGTQFLPAVAAEAGSSVLHLVWVSDLSGDDDICYASSNGLPAAPLTGVNLIDDTSRTNQRTPAIAVAEEAGDVRVFVCWQDARNATNTSDLDVYVVEIRDGDETNVLVGDGGTGTNQREPAIGVDVSGRPYVVWTDDRNAADQIYFAASTFVDPTPLAERLVAAAVGGTVGTASPVDADDVSVLIPAGACPYDVTVTIARIEDLQPGSTVDVLPYEFGPSGMQFNVAVTITIPYLIAAYGSDVPQPYWYDSLTGTLTQEGITNVQYVALSTTVGALRFQTTHFTPYTLVAATSDDGGGDADISSGSSGGGGGCSLSPVTGPCGPAEFFLPFALLATLMLAIRRGDKRRRYAVAQTGRSTGEGE